MRMMYVVCKRCGYAEKKEIYEAEEAVLKKLRLIPPQCSKCGSINVELTS